MQMMGIPWTSIFTSIPVWGIIIAHTTSNWGTYLMLTSIPTYMSAVLKFDIHTVSFPIALIKLYVA